MADPIPLLDLHAHFPMHLSFPPRPTGEFAVDKRNKLLLRIANRYNFEKAFLPRVTAPRARHGHVSAFGSVLYNPADEFCAPQDPFANLKAQLLQVEHDLSAEMPIARTAAELQDAFAARKQTYFHCVEGGFGIGDPRNVEWLAQSGVAYVVLAHLLFRGVATCVNGIPCFSDSFFEETFTQPNLGLTTLGHDIAEELCRHRVLMDITHASQKAIDDIFAIAAQYGAPVIASHTGVRGIADYQLNLSDATIERIRNCGGIIGVIFFRHWLEPSSAASSFAGHSGVQSVLDAIEYLRERGAMDHIGIGSDLDGFIEPVDGLENYGQVQTLAKALESRYGRDIAEKIMYRNALRVLREGWGGARTSAGKTLLFAH